jgi:hypothetical protein
VVRIAQYIQEVFILTGSCRSSSALSSSSSPIYLSYQGGGDYRGIYDIGLKGALEGYIGLLLNDPYKIDSMMGCVCGYLSLLFFFFFCLLSPRRG